MKRKLLTIISIGLLTVSNISSQVKYYEDISPIIYNNCSECHRPGEIGTMPLTNISEVTAYANMIEYVTTNKIMPPWQPDPNFSHFVDERVLTDAEIGLISQWITDGLQPGDPSNEAAMPNFTNSALGAPDTVISMSQKFLHQGNNTDRYQIFVIPSEFVQEKEIRGIEIVPENKNIAHHAIIAYEKNGGRDARSLDSATPNEYGYAESGTGFGSGVDEEQLSVWTPGNSTKFYPNKIGRKIPAGSDMLLQVHYAPYPIDEYDSTSINIYYAQDSIEREVTTLPFVPQVLTEPFIIYPNTVKEFHGKIPILQNYSLISILPHCHLLGKSWFAYATSMIGNDTIPLIKIDQWDFNWQGEYYFPNMVKIPAGYYLHVHATYDNTTNNPLNPNSPPDTVEWGERTQDEMYLFYLSFVNYQNGDENLSFTPEITEQFKTDLTTLYPIYPNPSSYKSTMSFNLNREEKIAISLYDINGKVIKTIVNNQKYRKGFHQLHIEVENIPNGVYLCELKTQTETKSQQLIVSH